MELWKQKLILAPMVRAGEMPLRLLALEYGADLVYSPEIIDSKLAACTRIVNERLGTVDFVNEKGGNAILQVSDRERGNNNNSNRLVCQIGSSDALEAMRAAEVVARDVAAVDLNMGCAKHFALAGGMGAALLESKNHRSSWEKACDIVRTLSRNLPSTVPVSCKIRLLPQANAHKHHKNNNSSHRLSGKDGDNRTVELCRRLATAGCSAVAIHCRHVGEQGLVMSTKPSKIRNTHFLFANK